MYFVYSNSHVIFAVGLNNMQWTTKPWYITFLLKHNKHHKFSILAQHTLYVIDSSRV